MEKKQTLVLVSMLLVVGLVCFFLGVMVGKSGEQSQVAEERMPVQEPLVAAQDAEVTPEPEEMPAPPTPAAEATDPPLSFYETLPEGQQNALGSGINLAPESVKPAPAEVSDPVKTVSSQKPSAAPVLPVAPKPVATQPVAATPAVSKPTAVASGSYLVQVASVKERQGANGLRDRMLKKGYAAFVEVADLGAKGIWYRVYAGPYGSQADADRAVSSLKADRISGAPLVKRR
ncbi:MAG: SPOR domain-containing protein [Syntrophotaleaceae bacterium]